MLLPHDCGIRTVDIPNRSAVFASRLSEHATITSEGYGSKAGAQPIVRRAEEGKDSRTGDVAQQPWT